MRKEVNRSFCFAVLILSHRKLLNGYRAISNTVEPCLKSPYNVLQTLCHWLRHMPLYCSFDIQGAFMTFAFGDYFEPIIICWPAPFRKNWPLKQVFRGHFGPQVKFSGWNTDNCCLFARLFKVKKNGVFLFGISFLFLEIFTFLYHANEDSDDVIGGSIKTV